MKKIALLIFIFPALTSFAQLSPAITSWIINTTGDTGYAGLLSNVQQVQYSTNNVYVSCTCIPGYDIGPWAGNPNIPANQNFVYKITLNPQANTGTPVSTPLGHIGVWSNGVSIFNAADAVSYNNMNIWHRNAIVAEGASFDDCLGHPAPNGEYHHHLNPVCLYNDSDSTVHSPIIGYAFDGYPVYGAYGFTDTNGTGPIKRMVSGYRLRNITVRQVLPNGTVLASNQYGPVPNTTYPLGLYLEDFEYIAGLGDLDAHNGRFCVTPEYPNGTYAYFVTLDSSLTAAYPYTLGPTYYGLVPTGNTGPSSGHNTVTETVQLFTSINTPESKIEFSLYPNPVAEQATLFVGSSNSYRMEAALYNPTGTLIREWKEIFSFTPYTIDTRNLSAGIYFLKIFSANETITSKISVLK